MNSIEPAAWLIDTALRLILRDGCIRIVPKEVAENDFRRPAAAHGKGVADDRPLRLSKETQDLAQVVHQAGHDEPAWLIGRANGLGGLHRMLDLREVDVGVAVVDKGVEKVERFPDGHGLAVQRKVLALFGTHERERLLRMV